MREKQLMLVVDDVSLNRVAFREMFKNNYEIIEAENGEVALKKIVENSHRLAMIILDLLMPVMDGLALLEIMQKNEKYKIIPVVAVTDNEQFRLDALRRGAWDFISKSNSREVIVARIENVISRRELVNERQKSAVLEKKVEDVRAESAGDMLKSVRKIYNNSPVAFSVAEVQTDAKGNPCGMVIRFANKACADLEGASVEEMYDHEYCKLRLAKDPQRLELYGQVAKSGAAQTFEREISQEKRNPYLKEELKEELEGIFNWAIKGLVSLKKRGRFLELRKELEMKELIQKIADTVEDWQSELELESLEYDSRDENGV
ncbi:MAG: response regulator, partial [Oscillospiraceae bacterium]